MTARENLRMDIWEVIPDEDAEALIDAYRAEVLAEAAEIHGGAHRKIAEVLDYLAEKDAVKLSEDAAVMGFHIVAVLDGPGPRADEVPVSAATRALVLAEAVAMIEDARAADEAMYRDEPAQINRRVGMREAMALLRREYEIAPGASRRPLVRRLAAGKDTRGAAQASTGESTQLPLQVRIYDSLAAFNTVACWDVLRLAQMRQYLAEHLAGELGPAEGESTTTTPGFFQPGHDYQRGRWTFTCLAIAPAPWNGETRAVGYLSRSTDGTGTTESMSQHTWDHDGWTEVAEAAPRAHAPSVPGTCARARATYDWVNGTTPKRETPCRPYPELSCVATCRIAESAEGGEPRG